jgi:hypothetical protein
MVAPSLADFTYQFGDNGFTLNSDFNGTPPFVDVQSITGLDSAPLRSNTTENEGTDGTFIDAQWMSMRTIVITGTVYDYNIQGQVLLTQLKGAYTNTAIQPFYFKHPGSPLMFINCQGGGLQYPVDTNWRLGQCNIQATLLASDPYIYGYPPSQASAPFQNAVGIGMGFNMGFNAGFGGDIFLPNCNVVNAGTHTAYPMITLYGPLTNPVLSDSISTTQMAFNLTLSASDWLTIDCRTKSVILDGQQSRRSSLQGLSFLSVPPQTSDTIYLSAASGSGSFSVALYSTYY